MDAKYVQANVNEALTEAMSAMIIAQPENPVDYIAKYLLVYVDRKQARVAEKLEIEKIEGALAAQEAAEQQAQFSIKAKEKESSNRDAALTHFLENISTTATTKQEAMDKSMDFLASYLDIPAAYVAIKKVAGENETLHYFSTNESQRTVTLGKKLLKAGEEPAERSGASFEAFKLPEVPEEEEAAPADDAEVDPDAPPAPAKAAPKPLPMEVENVMRDKRIKFFGVPKIGSYVALPFEYASLDHDAGCAGGGVGTPYTPNNLAVSLIVGIDTVGKYRELTPVDIEISQKVGEAMLGALALIEANSLFKKQTVFLDSFVSTNVTVVTAAAQVAEKEASALSGVAVQLPPECSDALKAVMEAQAALTVWNEAMAGETISSALFIMNTHMLPVPQIVSNLIYACACITNKVSDCKLMKDCCDDISWESIRVNIIQKLAVYMSAFAADETMELVDKDNSCAAIRKLTEDSNMLDPAQYPPTLAVCGVLVSWLSKALAARTACMADVAEKNGAPLETGPYASAPVPV